MHHNPVRDIPHYIRIFRSYLGVRIYLVMALTLIAALAEGVGIMMLLPLLQGLDGVDPGGSMPATGVEAVMRGLLSALGLSSSIVAVILFVTLAFCVKGVLMFSALSINARLGARLLRDLKMRLFHHYSRMGYQYYAGRDTGHFVNVITTQASQMLLAFRAMSQLVVNLLNSFIYIALVYVVAWRFGLMAMAFGIMLLAIFTWLNGRVRLLSRETSSESSQVAKLLVQFVQAFKYLVATNQVDPVRKSVANSLDRLEHLEASRGQADAITYSVREPAAVVFIATIALVQLVLLQQPFAPILVSLVLFHRAINALAAVQMAWQGALNYIGSVEMVDAEINDQAGHQEPDGRTKVGPLSRRIALRRVSYQYEASARNVLEDISLEIPAKTSIGLVGKSGAGKSTLADLIVLLLKPTTGEVIVDGIPGSQIELGSWRSQIGYVSQQTVVFDDTIANNICMWAGDPRADRGLSDRIRKAAGRAHIAHFIESLPDGYQTVVGDNGVRLSGGQRQRLFIARELFREPRVLILDEATSALDSKSEEAIQKSIDEMRGQVTLIIISHRLSTIRNVDCVYVLEDKRLVEQGTFESLCNLQGSHLKSLADLQSV